MFLRIWEMFNFDKSSAHWWKEAMKRVFRYSSDWLLSPVTTGSELNTGRTTDGFGTSKQGNKDQNHAILRCGSPNKLTSLVSLPIFWGKSHKSWLKFLPVFCCCFFFFSTDIESVITCAQNSARLERKFQPSWHPRLVYLKFQGKVAYEGTK